MTENTSFLIRKTSKGLVKKAYGIDFHPSTPDWKIELHCAFRYKLTLEKGGVGPTNHFWNFVKLLYPEYYNKENYFADLFIKELVEGPHKYIFCIGPGGFGKTTLTALYSVARFLENPKKTMVFGCSTTLESSETRIWGKIKQFCRDKEEFNSFLKITDKKIYYNFNSKNKKEKNTFHCMAFRPLPKGDGGADKVMRGAHPDERLILALDEMDQSAPIDDVVDNLERGGVEFQLIGLGNPSDRHSALGLVCEPRPEDGGWDGINALQFTDIKQCRWLSNIKDGVVLFFPGYLNPRIVLSEKYPHKKDHYDKVFNFYSTRDEIEDKKNSKKWMEQFIGFFPTEAAQGFTYLLDKSDIENTKVYEPGIFTGFDQPILCASCDLGFTHGGDKTLLRFARYGTMVNKKLGACFLGPSMIKEITIPKILSINKYKWLAMEILQQLKSHNVRPENFCIDSNAQGDAVVEYLKELGYKGFLCITSRGKASNTPLDRDRTMTAKDECDSKISEMWLFAKLLIINDQIRGLDKQSINEFTSRIYTTNKSKISLEEKLDYVKRMTSIGRRGHSPDHADTFVYMTHMLRKKGWLADFTLPVNDPDAFRATYHNVNSVEDDAANKFFEDQQVLEQLGALEDNYEMSSEDFSDDDNYL